MADETLSETLHRAKEKGAKIYEGNVTSIASTARIRNLQKSFTVHLVTKNMIFLYQLHSQP